MGLLSLLPLGSASRIDDQFERSGTRSYEAAFTADCDENFVRKNLGPSLIINYPHPSDLGQVVAGISVTQASELSGFVNPADPLDPNTNTPCFRWAVEIEYGPWDPLTHTATGDPADQPIDCSFQWQVFEQIADVAQVPGSSPPVYVPVVNSTGDPFDPPVTREQLKGILRVAWNAHTFDPATFFANGNCINGDVWNGFPKYSIKFGPPNMPNRLFSQSLNANYYRLEAEFAFNPNDQGWNAYPIDRGYRALNGSGAPCKIVDAAGQPISQPALLNGSGGVLTTLSSYVQLQFQVYQSILFATAFPNLTNLFPPP